MSFSSFVCGAARELNCFVRSYPLGLPQEGGLEQWRQCAESEKSVSCATDVKEYLFGLGRAINNTGPRTLVLIATATLLGAASKQFMNNAGKAFRLYQARLHLPRFGREAYIRAIGSTIGSGLHMALTASTLAYLGPIPPRFSFAERALIYSGMSMVVAVASDFFRGVR